MQPINHIIMKIVMRACIMKMTILKMHHVFAIMFSELKTDLDGAVVNI